MKGLNGVIVIHMVLALASICSCENTTTTTSPAETDSTPAASNNHGGEKVIRKKVRVVSDGKTISLVAKPSRIVVSKDKKLVEAKDVSSSLRLPLPLSAPSAPSPSSSSSSSSSSPSSSSFSSFSSPSHYPSIVAQPGGEIPSYIYPESSKSASSYPSSSSSYSSSSSPDPSESQIFAEPYLPPIIKEEHGPVVEEVLISSPPVVEEIVARPVGVDLAPAPSLHYGPGVPYAKYGHAYPIVPVGRHYHGYKNFGKSFGIGWGPYGPGLGINFAFGKKFHAYSYPGHYGFHKGFHKTFTLFG